MIAMGDQKKVCTSIVIHVMIPTSIDNRHIESTTPFFLRG